VRFGVKVALDASKGGGITVPLCGDRLHSEGRQGSAKGGVFGCTALRKIAFCVLQLPAVRKGGCNGESDFESGKGIREGGAVPPVTDSESGRCNRCRQYRCRLSGNTIQVHEDRSHQHSGYGSASFNRFLPENIRPIDFE
jgi:hypothetical protein